VPPDLTQEEHIDGLPIGTRGGAVVPYTFPADAEYEIQIRLRRDRDELVEGLSEAHDLELLLDRQRVQVFTVKPPQREPGVPDEYQPSQEKVDAHLKIRVPVGAGPHMIGVAFLKKPSCCSRRHASRTRRTFNSYRHRACSRRSTRCRSSVRTRRRARGHAEPAPHFRLACGRPAQGDAVGRTDLSTLMRRPTGVPSTPIDVKSPLELFQKARAGADFDAGIEMALSAVLVSPEFLFRVERIPPAFRRTRRTASAISRLRRACPSSCGAAFPTTSCSTRRSPARCTSRSCSSGRCAACSPTRRARS
jgi:hypothetical protein